MKYEYLCGYESDFFTMPANVIAVVRLDHCVQGLTEFSQIIECGKPVLAMRRIIKDPKRWTWEDKKAGRLPEVGAECIKEGKVVTILNVNERYVTYIDKNNSRASSENVSINSVNSFLKPIETPAEKAARLKSEWCAKDAKQLKNLEYTSTLTSIYDALLSGELQAPKGGE